MPRKSRRNKRSKTRKQKLYKMIGCSKCGPNCRCKPKCTCKPNCPGSCSRNQKAGMGCGPAGCPIAPYPMNGGDCDVMGCGRILGSYQNGGMCGNTMCRQIPVISRGGGFYKPPPPMPGPFVGENWGPLVKQWPGVDGISANRNYLDLNLYKNDPQTMMLIRGGRRKNKTYKKQKGGTFIPQELVNLGRDFAFNIRSAYNSLNAIPVPPSPLPYKDQLK
jgi:hypothetical protein